MLPDPIVHQQILAGRTTKPVVAVSQIWRSAVGVAKAGRVWKCLDLTSAFLTVVTIANGAQDRLAGVSEAMMMTVRLQIEFQIGDRP